MSESTIIQILTLVSAIVASILSILTRMKQGETKTEVTDLKVHINSRMDNLLETTKVAAALQGRADLRAEQAGTATPAQDRLSPMPPATPLAAPPPSP